MASSVEIKEVSLSGSGCPDGSVQVVLAPDASAFTVLYDRFQLQVTPGNPKGEMKCEVQIKLKKPRLQGFAIESADFRGFVWLDHGMTAEQTVSVGAGAIKEIRQLTSEFGSQKWNGPISENYILSTVRPINGPKLLNCLPAKDETKIIVKSKIKIEPRHSAGIGQMSVDTADGRVSQTYRLRWDNCARRIGGAIGGILGALSGR